MKNIQSAVEWLMNQITFEEEDENNPEGKGRFASFQDYVNLKEYFDKAIAIEKEQIRKAYDMAINHQLDRYKSPNSEEYYEKNYGNVNN